MQCSLNFNIKFSDTGSSHGRVNMQAHSNINPMLDVCCANPPRW